MTTLPLEIWSNIISVVPSAERLVLTGVSKDFYHETYYYKTVPRDRSEFLSLVMANDWVSIVALSNIQPHWISSGYKKACKHNLPLMIKLLYKCTPATDKGTLVSNNIEACYKSSNLHLLIRKPNNVYEKAAALGFALAGQHLEIVKSLLSEYDWCFISEYTSFLSKMLFCAGPDIVNIVLPLLPREFVVDMVCGVTGAIIGGHWDYFEACFYSYCVETAEAVANRALYEALRKGNVEYVNKLLAICQQHNLTIYWAEKRAPALISNNDALIDLVFAKSPMSESSYFPSEVAGACKSLVNTKRVLASIEALNPLHMYALHDITYIIEQRGNYEVISYIKQFIVDHNHILTIK